jgi:hypothetical protein
MNGRHVEDQTTPEARLAVVAQRLLKKFDPNSNVPDFADFRDALAPYVKKEILLARIIEARTCGGLALSAHIAALAHELAEIEKRIPVELYFDHVASGR